jgi:hypothetical protein
MIDLEKWWAAWHHRRGRRHLRLAGRHLRKWADYRNKVVDEWEREQLDRARQQIREGKGRWLADDENPSDALEEE